MSKFQIGLLIFFGAFIFIAVALFSRSRGSVGGSVSLTVWGTMSSYDFNALLAGAGLDDGDRYKFTYVEKQAETLNSDFTEALAVGGGPDLIMVPLDNLVRLQSKLLLIPKESLRPADFISAFVEEGELFLTSQGTYALPLYVDPMVLYWNRDLFTKESLARPPSYWDEIYDYIDKLNVKDSAGNITTSAIALGEAKNIPHEKEILSLLLLQAGSPVTSYVGGELRASLNTSATVENPARSALGFYTQFADPTKVFNTWNRSLISADTHFASGKSAMYLGFASEMPVLKAKNPTLNLGIVPVPQSRVSGKSVTYGRLYGLAVSRGAKNPTQAFQGALVLVSKDTAAALAALGTYIPARRDLLSQKPTDPAGFTFYGAALQARGWLDPDTAKSKKIFADMAESVTSGRARVEEAVSTAQSALDALLK